MDRQHRRDLKHDRFVDEVGLLTERARANQRGLLFIGAAAVAIALIAYGIYFWEIRRVVVPADHVLVLLKKDGHKSLADGQVVIPTFDEALLAQALTLDAGCPLSGQPETSKCAVRVERPASRGGP